jgi:hypothetical protein
MEEKSSKKHGGEILQKTWRRNPPKNMEEKSSKKHGGEILQKTWRIGYEKENNAIMLFNNILCYVIGV